MKEMKEMKQKSVGDLLICGSAEWKRR